MMTNTRVEVIGGSLFIKLTFLKEDRYMPGLNFLGYHPVKHVVPEWIDQYFRGSLFQSVFILYFER